MDGLWVLDSAVRAILPEAGSVVKEPSSNGLLDGIMVAQVAGQLNLCSVHETQQLLSDVPHPLHHFHLHQQMHVSYAVLVVLRKANYVMAILATHCAVGAVCSTFSCPSSRLTHVHHDA